MATNRVKTRGPFNKLFPIDEKTIDAIADHMQNNGYDESQPVIIWDQSSQEAKHALYIIDGHTRLLAAKKAKLSPVYVARMNFPDDNAALQYAIHNQRDRRNFTDADILRCVEMLDERKAVQKDEKGKFAVGSSEPTGRTADKTASIIGTSPTKIKKIRTVIDHGDDQTKQDILDGEKSIHKAYKETQEKRKKITQEHDVVKLYNMIKRIRKFLLKKDKYSGWLWNQGVQKEMPKHINSEEAIIAWKAERLMSRVSHDAYSYLNKLIPPEPEKPEILAPDVTSEDFTRTVLKSDTPVLIMFHREGCRPCRKLSPTIDKLFSEYKNRVQVYKCSVKQGEAIFSQYNIETVPQLILFKSGEAHWIDPTIRTKVAIKKEVTKILKTMKGG